MHIVFPALVKTRPRERERERDNLIVIRVFRVVFSLPSTLSVNTGPRGASFFSSFKMGLPFRDASQRAKNSAALFVE